MTCAVEGCEKPRRGKHCAMHEGRLRLTGTTDPGPKARPTLERFWSRVDKSDTCWLWVGSTNDRGYGTMTVNARQTYVHRFSYELVNGPIPKGLVIDHICHVRHCVNPQHLQAVTVRQNAQNFSRSVASRPASGVRGVRWDATRRKWRASVTHAGHTRCRSFDTLEAAAIGVVEMRNQLHSNNLLDRT